MAPSLLLVAFLLAADGAEDSKPRTERNVVYREVEGAPLRVDAYLPGGAGATSPTWRESPRSSSRRVLRASPFNTGSLPNIAFPLR